MIYNLNKDEYATKQSYDVCICGAGVAGITVAIELAEKGKKVALFEAGDEGYTKSSQSIYDAESTGLLYYGTNACRLRYLGGTSNHWTGRTMLLQPIDFDERSFFPLPGWPIKMSELDKYKLSAYKVLGLPEQIHDTPRAPKFTSESMKVIGYGEQPPVRFGKKYYDNITNSKNIDLFLNANLTDIKLNDNLSRVNKIIIKNFKNKTYTYTGKNIVLAMGTIENARLLLNSNSQLPKGIGNDTDYVGRCFMEHFNIALGEYSVNPDSPIWKIDGNLEFFPTDKFAIDNKIGTSVISFGRADSRSYGRLKVIRKAIRKTVCGYEDISMFVKELYDFTCPGDGIINTLCEQSPNKDSRITLSNEKDALGIRKALLDWRINELDKRTIRTLALEIAKEVARLDIGRVKLKDYIFTGDFLDKLGAHCHQMGTTRMSRTSDSGVVDVNCKVFGVDNLYIAGSSVFSTGGGVNPTLSIVQLSLRLADHLSRL